MCEVCPNGHEGRGIMLESEPIEAANGDMIERVKYECELCGEIWWEVDDSNDTEATLNKCVVCGRERTDLIDDQCADCTMDDFWASVGQPRKFAPQGQGDIIASLGAANND